MSTTVSKHQNLIGGEWVDASSGETMEVLNPSTGEVIAEVPRAIGRRRRPCGPGGEEGPCRVARDDARRARRDAAQARGRARRARGGARRARVAERRQAALVCEGRDSGRDRQHPLLRRRRPRARRQVGRRVHARLHLLAPARADRDRRRNRALELPADDGDLEARACAGRGQRAGAEAVRADAADDAALRAARGGDPAARRPERHHRRRRARRARRSSSTRTYGSCR